MSVPSQKVIEQVSPSTGLRRVSTDGGQTWRILGALKPRAPVPPIPADAAVPPPPAPASKMAQDAADLEASRSALGIVAPTPKPAKMGIGDAAGNAMEEGFGFGLGAKAAGLGYKFGGDEDIPRAAARGIDAPLQNTTDYEVGRDVDRAETSKAFRDQPAVAFPTAIASGIPAAIATRGGSAEVQASRVGIPLAERLYSAYLEAPRIGAMFGLAQGLGHADINQADTGDVAAAKATLGPLSAANSGAQMGVDLAPVSPLLQSIGDRVWDMRQNPLSPGGITMRDAVAEGAEPAVFARGGVKPGSGVAADIEASKAQGSLDSPAGVAQRRLDTVVDQDLMARANPIPLNNDMPLSGATPTDIEARNLALRLRDAGTEKVNASKKLNNDTAATADEGTMAPLASAGEAAKNLRETKYTQRGGRLPDPAAVAERDSLLGAAGSLESKVSADDAAMVNEWLSYVDAPNKQPAGSALLDEMGPMSRVSDDGPPPLGNLRENIPPPDSDVRASNLESAKALREAAGSIDAEPKDFELPFAPTALMRKIEGASMNTVLDGPRLNTLIDLVQKEREAAQAAKSPKQTSLLKVEDALSELQKQYHPEQFANREASGLRAAKSQAATGSLGTGKETFNPDVRFGPEVQSLVEKLVTSKANANDALLELVSDAKDRKDLVDAINHVRETAMIEKNAKNVGSAADTTTRQAGDEARAALGPRAQKAASRVRGAQAQMQIANEPLPLGVMGERALATAVWRRLAALKKLPNAARLSNVPQKQNEAQQ